MMKLNAAHRLLASQIFYRGLTQTWSDEHAKNQHIIFITPDRDYALEYAKDEQHVLEFHADIGHSFDFGFRTLQTEVQLKDVTDRVKRGILSQFQEGHITREKGMELMDELAEVKGSGYKHVWEWYMQLPELVRILKAAGFNSVEGKEGVNDDIPTYGVFSVHQLKRV
jgi:hypothetical protein